MVRLSLLAASSFASLAVAQVQSQVPEVPALDAPEDNCGGCYVLADLVNVVFGTVQTSTVTEVVSVGLNFSRTTTTVSTVAPVLVTATNDGGIQFSYSPEAGLIPGPPAPTEFLLPANTAGTAVISGATLTSPTQYNLVVSYTISNFQISNGQCVGVPTPITLPIASSYMVESDSGDGLISAENSFISAIGVTCMAGGGNATMITAAPVDLTTITSTTSSTFTPTPSSTSVRAPLVTATSTTSIVFNTSLALPTGAQPTFTPQLPVVGGAAIATPGIIGGAAAIAIGIAAAIML